MMHCNYNTCHFKMICSCVLHAWRSDIVCLIARQMHPIIHIAKLIFTATVQVQIVVAPMSENVTTPNTLMIWRCIAIGLPLPNITWSRNGLPLLNPEMTTNTVFTKGGVTFVQSTLEMCIDDRASGEYTCIASNSYTNDSADYSIFGMSTITEYIFS